MLAVVRKTGRHAGEGQRRLEQGLAQVLAPGVVMLRPVRAVAEQIGLIGGALVGEVGGQHTAVALVLAVAVALFHQHLEAVAGLEVADEVDLRAEQVAQGQGQLRAFADVGHGLEQVVIDGGFHLGEGGHIFDGLHAGHGLFHPFHHQTAAGVDLVLEALELAGSGVHHDGVGLAGAEGPHGKDLPGGAHIGMGAGSGVAFDDFADGVALFHRTVDHGLAVDDLALRAGAPRAGPPGPPRPLHRERREHFPARRPPSPPRGAPPPHPGPGPPRPVPSRPGRAPYLHPSCSRAGGRCPAALPAGRGGSRGRKRLRVLFFFMRYTPNSMAYILRARQLSSKGPGRRGQQGPAAPGGMFVVSICAKI